MAKKQPKKSAKPKPSPRPAKGAARLTPEPTFEELLAALQAAYEGVETAAADLVGAAANLDDARAAMYAAQNAYRGNPTVANAEAWLAATDAFHTAEGYYDSAVAAHRAARQSLADAHAAVQAAVTARVLGQ